MRLVQWIDDEDYKRGAYVRDTDPDDLAPISGIPHDPPNLDRIDWSEVKRTLHNQLAERELFTWEDVQRSRDGLTGAVLASIKRQLIQLYRT